MNAGVAGLMIPLIGVAQNAQFVSPSSHGRNLVGVLTVVHSTPGFFNGEHLDLIQAIGHLAGVAIYNARLFMRLEKAQKRYQTLFEASSDLLFITDWDGRVIETNRAVEKVTNYKPRFSHDAHIMDFHKPDYSRLGAGFSTLKQVDSVIYESELLIDPDTTTPGRDQGCPCHNR